MRRVAWKAIALNEKRASVSFKKNGFENKNRIKTYDSSDDE